MGHLCALSSWCASVCVEGEIRGESCVCVSRSWGQAVKRTRGLKDKPWVVSIQQNLGLCPGCCIQQRGNLIPLSRARPGLDFQSQADRQPVWGIQSDLMNDMHPSVCPVPCWIGAAACARLAGTNAA